MWKKVKTVTTAIVTSALLAGAVNPMQVFAAEPEQLKVQADEAFKNQEYEQAKELYEQLVESGYAQDVDYVQGGFVQCVEGNYYIADEWFAKAFEIMSEETNPNAASAYKIRNAYCANEYWYTEQDYNDSSEMNARTGMGCRFYAKALLDCKKPQEALTFFEDALQGYAGDAGTQGAIKEEMGHAYLALENYEEAQACFEEARDLTGKEENYQNNMVKLMLAKDDSNVDSIFAEVMPDAKSAQKAKLLQDNGYAEEAAVYYEKALSEDGEEVRCDMARNYYQMDEPEMAAKLLEELLTEDPENDSALNILGSIYCDGLARYEEAEALFDQCIELIPNADITMSNKAVVFRKAGDFDKVADQYRFVAEKFPNLKKYYANYISYKKDITAQEALTFCSGYEGWPTDERLQAVLLGDAIDTEFMTTKTLESFLAYFDDISEKYPDDYNLLYHKAQLLEGLERYDEALDVRCHAMEIAGIMSYYATNALGNLYYRMGDFYNAMVCYEENAATYKDNSLRLCIADCYLALEEYGSMEQMLADYLAEGGEETEATSYRMMAAYMKEDYEELLTYADMLIAENSRDAKAKAYKVVAMRALDMDGTEELIREIDSQGFPAGDVTKMTIDSILGRWDEAKKTYAVIQENIPGLAITCKNNYELKAFFENKEEQEANEGVEENAEQEVAVTESETPQTGEEETSQNEAIEEAGEEAKKSGVIPTVAGVTILISVIGILAVLLGKKRSNAKKTK